MFITNATIGNYLVVLCLTDPKNPKSHNRMSTIIVETDRPGYEANKLLGKLSIRCSDTGEVLQGRESPPGKPHRHRREGFLPAHGLLQPWPLNGGGALAVGTAQGALEKAITHVKKRRAFGAPLRASRSSRPRSPRWRPFLEAGRSLLLPRRPRPSMPARSILPSWPWRSGTPVRSTVKIADEAIQLHGGYGHTSRSTTSSTTGAMRRSSRSSKAPRRWRRSSSGRRYWGKGEGGGEFPAHPPRSRSPMIALLREPS